MKLCVALVHVVVILVLAGSSLGDGEGDLAQPRTCSLTIDEGEPREPQILSQIYSLGIKCLDATGTDVSFLLYVETSEQYKSFFQNMCQKQSQIRECLADVALKSRECQIKSRHQLFQVFREFMENTLDAGCVQDGEVLANMVATYKHNSNVPSKLNHLQHCLVAFVGRTHLSIGQDLSDFSRMFIFYRDVEQAKECLRYQPEGDRNLAGGMVTLLSEISDKLKCFHPQNDSVVLCKNIDAHSVGSPMACPIKSKDELITPLYGLFINRLPLCVYAAIQYDLTQVNILGSLEQSRAYFKNLCQRKHITQSCIAEVGRFSSACLDTNHHRMVATAEDFFDTLLEQLCKDDGLHIANVLYKVYSDVANSSEPTVLTECANVAHTPGEAIDTIFTSAKTLKYYQELKVFKGCLVNKLKLDKNTESSAELVLNGVINNMKCINPEETNAVFCDKIPNNA